MARGQATTTQTNGTPDTKKTLTAIEAITKITKVLDQLAVPSDRKRVLAFVNESNENPSSNASAE